MSAPHPIILDPEHPWDRQTGESDEAFRAFTIYRDYGPKRSLVQVARILDISKTTAAQFSTKHEWGARSAMYDAYLDSERRRVREEEFLEMERRHAQALGAAFGAVVMPIAALGRPRRMPDGSFLERREELDAMATGPLVRLAQESARILAGIASGERVVREAPDAGGEVLPPGPAEGLVPADEARVAGIYAALEEAGLTPLRLVAPVASSTTRWCSAG